MKQLKITQIKQALSDERFRKSLPAELLPEVMKFLSNPGCACNTPLYRKVIKTCANELKAYYPDTEIDESILDPKVMVPRWKVINCTVDKLEDELRKLGVGRKQVEMARYMDNITVVINELD